MVNLGWMLPTSEEYEEKIRELSCLHEVSVEKMLEIVIDYFIKNQGV